MSQHNENNEREIYEKLVRWLDPKELVRIERQSGLIVLTRSSKKGRVKGHYRKEWEKLHKGRLAALAESETAALNSVMGKFTHVQQPLSIGFPTAMGLETNAAVNAQAPSRDRVSRFLDAGLDIEDWLFLCHQQILNPFHKPEHALALIRSILVALKEIHDKEFIHCDIKLDNICMDWERPNDVDIKGAMLRGNLDLNKVTLVDVALVLGPARQARDLWREPPEPGKTLGKPLPIGQGGGSDYMSPHFKEAVRLAMQDDFSLLRQLDWRIDLFSFGKAVNSIFFHVDWAKDATPEQCKFKESLAQRLCDYDTHPSLPAPGLPHEEMIEEIDVLCGGKTPNLVPCAISRRYPNGRTFLGEWIKSFQVVSLRERVHRMVQSASLTLRRVLDPVAKLGESALAGFLFPLLFMVLFVSSALLYLSGIGGLVKHISSTLALLIFLFPLGLVSLVLLADGSKRRWPYAFVLPLLGVVLFGAFIEWERFKFSTDVQSTGSAVPAKDPVTSALQAFPQHPGAKFKATLWAGGEQGAQTQFAVGEPFRFTVTNPLPTLGYLTVFAADAQDAQAKQLRVVIRGQQMAPGARVSFPGALEAADPSWRVQSAPGVVQLVAVVTPKPVEWNTTDSAQQTRVVSLRNLNNSDDITALFNCAARTGAAAQDCQYASQNFGASPVASYQIVGGNVSQGGGQGSAPVVALSVVHY